jgi:hypothetical protein
LAATWREEFIFMQCPNCESNWPAGVKFCGSCGTKLVKEIGGGLPPAQAKVNDQLKKLLPRIGLGNFVEVEPGHHMCRRGSTHVDVRVIDFGGRVAVRSVAPVAIGSNICPDLMKFLLNRNAGFLFGAFGIDLQGVVIFSHTIMASSMDVEELGSSVSMVLRVADDYDDQIVAQWGGKTMQQTVIDQVIPARLLQRLIPRK